MKKTIANPDSLIDLLRDGYYINMPVSRKAIDFYVYEKDAHHHMLIYGVDIPNRQYLCKDYKEHEFISFETSFDGLMESSELYYNPSSTKSNGILAFKIDDSIPHQINCSKILFEFTKLHFSKMVNDIDTYDIGAIMFYLNDIEQKPVDDRFYYRWYETANYLRESAKLMKIRFTIISEALHFHPSELSKMVLDQLLSTVNKLFFSVLKAFHSNTSDSCHKRIFADNCWKCIRAFNDTADMFQDVIYKSANIANQ